jgi:hypothetical protein
MVHELLAEGHGMRAIARHLGGGRHTVQRYAHAKTWQELVDGRGGDQRVPVMTDQQEPFGLVASVPIAWRTLDACPAHRTS